MKLRCFDARKVALGILGVLVVAGWPNSGHSQGTVALYNHVQGEVETHVYLGGDHQISGNGADDYPPGAQDWTGFTGLLGVGYTAQLWGAAGANQPGSSLLPVLPTTSLQTVAAGAGILVSAGFVQLPNVLPGELATIALRVWDNRGGTVTSWAMAQGAGVALGESPLFNSLPLGAAGIPGPSLVGLQSFNIYQVPEPSSLALSGLGLAALWVFHRLGRLPGRDWGPYQRDVRSGHMLRDDEAPIEVSGVCPANSPSLHPSTPPSLHHSSSPSLPPLLFARNRA